VCHGGFAYDTGSWKAKLCVQGNRMMGNLSEELGFDFRRSGKVLVGNTPAERASLEKTREQGIRNGVQGLEMIDSERLHRMIPGVIGQFALYSPQSGIIDPFGYTIALRRMPPGTGSCISLPIRRRKPTFITGSGR
jgi:glycerol-3-phosphate dehydrogenase